MRLIVVQGILICRYNLSRKQGTPTNSCILLKRQGNRLLDKLAKSLLISEETGVTVFHTDKNGHFSGYKNNRLRFLHNNCNIKSCRKKSKTVFLTHGVLKSPVC